MNQINDIKIELIPTLITLLDTLSVTETAKKLGVTQSAISHSLKKLRHQLKDEIVIREGHHLLPTAKAEKIYPSLKRWMSELDYIIDATDFDPKTSKRNFYIATSDIIEQMFMAKIISQLKTEAPQIGIRLVRWNLEKIPSQLLSSEIDGAIGVRSFDNPNLMQRVLYKEVFICAARKGHPIFKTKKDLESFLSYPHTMTSSGDRVKGVVDSALEKINRTRNLTHTVANFSSAPFILENSDCILTAPSRFLHFAVSATALKPLIHH